MHDLPTQAQHLATLRARILLDDHALAQARRSDGLPAAEAFAERLRIGAMRSDNRDLTAALRRNTCANDPRLTRRFDLLMDLVDEVATLEFVAATGGDQRRAVATNGHIGRVDPHADGHPHAASRRAG
jgi:hypothetical protein